MSRSMLCLLLVPLLCLAGPGCAGTDNPHARVPAATGKGPSRLPPPSPTFPPATKAG
jgi:hypothetical protein